jgi:hypothetical protein
MVRAVEKHGRQAQAAQKRRRGPAPRQRRRRDTERFRSDQTAGGDPVEQFNKEHDQAYREMPPVNILLTGQTGVDG